MDGLVQWLDSYGRAGWLTATVVGFIVFWPIGLAILGFMIWSGRMGSKSSSRREWKGRFFKRGAESASADLSSGNTAFDEYREETLRRLEEEQREFDAFLANLRMARDRQEFEDFMSSRKSGKRWTKSSDETSEDLSQGPSQDRDLDTGPLPQGA